MRKFIAKISLFLVIFAVLNLLLFISFNEIYLEEYRKDPLSYSSFLFADSHGLPLNDNLEQIGVYNFSAGSESFTDIKRKLTYLIENGRVELILLQVEGQVLSNFRNGSNNGDRSVMYASYADFENIYSYLKEAWIRYYIVLLNPKSQSLFRYYIRSQFADESRVRDTGSASWTEIDENERKQRSVERAGQFYNGGLSEEQIESYMDILNICRENNIRVIGIKFPLPVEMIHALSGEAGEEVYENYLTANRLFSDSGIEIWDYEKRFMDKPELFRDEDHLSIEGGVLLGDSLSARILHAGWSLE